jgi:hypothetical protein
MEELMLRPYFWGAPIEAPEQVQPLLAKLGHWKEGRSAYELAHSWLKDRDLPQSVKGLMDSDAALSGATLIEAFFERHTELDNLGRASQTDLLALLKITTGLAVLGIEAKVTETFGNRVSEWDDGSPGKSQRLSGMLKLLCLDVVAARPLRYQLIHRTVATVLEAERYGAGDAAMIVQSFDSHRTGFSDFQAFATAMRSAVEAPGTLSKPIKCCGVSLRLGWAADCDRSGSSLTEEASNQ